MDIDVTAENDDIKDWIEQRGPGLGKPKLYTIDVIVSAIAISKT